MNITILDFAIIAVPLAIVMAALVSRLRTKISLQTDEVNEMRKAVLKKHIQEIQARAQRNPVPLGSSRDVHRSEPADFLIRAG